VRYADFVKGCVFPEKTGGKMTDLSTISTPELVDELSKRDEVTVYPRWVTPDEVFGHRQTLDGRYTMMVVRE